MVGDANIYSILIWLVGAAVLFFSIAILIGSKSSSSRSFGLASMAVAFWCAALGAYFYATDPAIVDLANRLTHAAGSLIAVLFFYFSLSFGENDAQSKTLTALLVGIEAVLIYVLLSSNLIVEQVYLSEQVLERGFILGSYGWTFYVHFIIFFFAGFSVLISQLRSQKDEHTKSQLKSIVVSTATGIALGGFVGVVLPYLSTFEYYWLTPLGVLPWILGTSYAIVKHGAFAVRLVVGEFFIFALSAILFLNVILGGGGSAPVEASLAYQFSLVPVLHLTIGIVIASYAVILLLNQKSSVVRISAMMFVALSAWLLSAGLFYAGNAIPDATIWIRASYFFGGHLSVLLLLLYVLHLYKGKMFSWRGWLGLLVAEIALGFVYIGTNLVIAQALFLGPTITERSWVLGTLGPLHIFQTLALVGISIGYLYLNRKKADEHLGAQQHSRWMLFGTLLGIPPGAVILAVAPIIDQTNLAWTAPLFGLIWISFSTFAMVRYDVSNRKLFFAEVLILSMLAAMFANIFITEQAFGDIARVAILVSFLLAGLLFIRNTVQGERQREELGLLTDRLENLNANLESLVLKRTEEINRERIHTNTIIEHLNQGVIELTPSRAVTRINSAAEQFLGVTRKQVVGRQFIDNVEQDAGLKNMSLVSFPYDNPQIVCELPPSAELPPDADVREIEVMEPSRRNLQIVTVPVEQADGEKSLVRVLRDITRAILISRSKNEFVSIVAHQLRTPLTGLRWTLEQAMGGELGAVTKKQSARLEQVTGTNDHLLSLVNDLLLVSRIEAEKEDYIMEKLNLTTIVRAALTRAKQLEMAKDITINTSLPRNGIRLTGDARLISQIMVGLLDNAVRYNEPGGTVDVSLSTSEQGILLSVINTGLTVPPSEFDQLFSKFYRSTLAIKRHTEGSGLSLFIAKHILEHHGGTIVAKPNKPSGLAVYVTLPTNV